MKFRKRMALLTLLMMFGCLFLSCTVYVSAKGDMDGVTTQSDSGSGKDYGGSVSDYLQNREVIGDEEMQKANNLASPVVSVIGTIGGFLVLIASAAIFAITALDLLYIGVPFTRTFLAPAQSSGGGMGMGGMGMGGMGSMGGAQQQPQGKQWVSDEALVAVQSMSGTQSSGGGMGMGGMGMGMGGMGSMGGAQQQPQSTKSVIMQYLKKRVFFIVIFFVCTIVLTSSIVSDCGINLGKLALKAISALNGNMSDYAAQ